MQLVGVGVGGAGSTQTTPGVKGHRDVQLPLSTFKTVSRALKDASGARARGTPLQSVAPQPAYGPVP